MRRRCRGSLLLLLLPFLHGLHIQRFKVDLRELDSRKATFYNQIVEAFSGVRKQGGWTSDSNDLAKLRRVCILDEENTRLLNLNQEAQIVLFNIGAHGNREHHFMSVIGQHS